MSRNGTASANAPPTQSMRVKDIVHGEVEARDSAYFSSDGSSKHTSAASFAPNIHSPPGSGPHSSPAEKTPSPTTPSHHAPPLVSPTGSGMSTGAPEPFRASGPPGPDPRQHERSSQPELGVNGVPYDHDSISRRTSVDSRINQNFSDMRLAGSPYYAHNQSSSSIQNTLTTQRHPRPGLENLAVHRISNGYQPSAERNPDTPSNRASRIAPVIGGPTAGTVARAAEPTKGQAWAFPDSEMARASSNGHAVEDSRRSSVAESFASSQFTSESRLPPGQRRLDEAGDYVNNLVNAHQDYSHPPLETRMSQDDDEGSPGDRTLAGSQPYSRTPESRQSHKLAERKRRTEMKELFENLRDLMPQDRGAKASKWEILQKAIAEHSRQQDVIRQIQSHYNQCRAEADMLRQDNHALHQEIQQLRMQVPGHRGSYSSAAAAPPPPPTSGPPPGAYQPDPYANHARTELPPLRSLGAGPLPPQPEGMTGVQYEGSRPPSFRSERP